MSGDAKAKRERNLMKYKSGVDGLEKKRDTSAHMGAAIGSCSHSERGIMEQRLRQDGVRYSL